MKNLLKKAKIEELFEHLFEHGKVECGHPGVEDFIDELGEMLHYNKRFKKVKSILKRDAVFQQRFEDEIRRIVTERNGV